MFALVVPEVGKFAVSRLSNQQQPKVSQEAQSLYASKFRKKTAPVLVKYDVWVEVVVSLHQ